MSLIVCLLRDASIESAWVVMGDIERYHATFPLEDHRIIGIGIVSH